MSDIAVTPARRTRLGLPKVSRVWLIAMRDFVGYVKTWGFWLSFLFPIMGGVLGILFASSGLDLSPPKYETVIDQTGMHGEALIAFQGVDDERLRAGAVRALGSAFGDAEEQKAFKAYVEAEGAEAGMARLREERPGLLDDFELPTSNLIFVDPPADTLEGMRPYLDGTSQIMVDGKPQKLNGAVIIRGTKDAPDAQYWSRNFNNAPAQRLVERYFRELARGRYLESGGLTLEGYDAAVKGRTDVEIFDPARLSSTAQEETKEVSMLDRMPFFVGMGLSFFLLMTIFAGSFMLLTSMIEEKMNKLLEMMLASTRFSEIMLGKMLGAALLTLASLAPYILTVVFGIIGFLLFGNPEQVSAIAEAFPLSTLLISFAFLVLGYMLYASILIALGSLAQSMQDAQTLSVPILVLMFAGIFIIMIGSNGPDSPIIEYASMFPLTSPFAMMIRLHTDPPLWQIAVSLILLFGSVVGVMWLCARIFRFGVLSGAGVGAIKGWFRRTVLRKAH